jgi:hypothetical protein
MNVTSEVVGQLAGQIAPLLQEKHGFATQTQIDKAVADILKKTAERQARGSNFSLSKMIRGLRIESGQPAINKQSAEGDVAYVRAMSTGSTPGSYLVPTIEADEIIGYLNSGGVARAAGVRICRWPALRR